MLEPISPPTPATRANAGAARSQQLASFGATITPPGRVTVHPTPRSAGATTDRAARAANSWALGPLAPVVVGGAAVVGGAVTGALVDVFPGAPGGLDNRGPVAALAAVVGDKEPAPGCAWLPPDSARHAGEGDCQCLQQRTAHRVTDSSAWTWCSTLVPSKKRGLVPPKNRTGLVNTKSRKSSLVMRPSSTNSWASGTTPVMSITSK